MFSNHTQLLFQTMSYRALPSTQKVLLDGAALENPSIIIVSHTTPFSSNFPHSSSTLGRKSTPRFVGLLYVIISRKSDRDLTYHHRDISEPTWPSKMEGILRMNFNNILSSEIMLREETGYKTICITFQFCVYISGHIQIIKIKIIFPFFLYSNLYF